MLKYSIIIPCHNEEKFIYKILEDINNINYKKKDYEIIVVDNASTDKTCIKIWEFLYKKKITNLKIVHENIKGVSIARNTGADNSSAEYCIFLDADNRIGKEFLNNIDKKFKDDVIGASIKTLPFDGGKLIYLFFLIIDLIKKYSGRAFGKSVINKKVFKIIGKFNKNIVLGENVEIFTKLKKYCINNNKKISYIDSPIYCSSRRFSKENKFILLYKWLIAYLGKFNLKYKTMDEFE